MKLGLLAMILLIGSCAPPSTSRPGPGTYGGTTRSVSGSGTSSASTIASDAKPATSYSQDAVECERKAALSQAGSKGEAFANCMRSKGHSPSR
jgi:hypothetical protein